MQHDPLTHASFFSGAGGLDLGLERAGWRTVSFSEVDPYACAILRHRWPDVPNLGSIVDLADGVRLAPERSPVSGLIPDAEGRERPRRRTGDDGRADWHDATLWSGGFPCQDLSVAGKRAGMGSDGARTRSGLAFAYLDLVERHRPPWVLLENVPGLLSSHSGRDLAALVHRLGDLGYGWAYRVLDARWFGVPQRRRRVFILAHHVDGHPDYNGPAEVLAVGTRCGRHPSSGREEGEEPADRFADGTGGAGILPQSVSAKWRTGYSGPAGDEHHNLVVAGPPTYARRVRAAPGLAGWTHDRPVEEVTELLPLGLDSHRYRVIGNGVAAPVATWIGQRLAAYIAQEASQ